MNFNGLPKDPIMLLSFLNTKMRDEKVSFEDIAAELELSSEETESILKKLENVGYSYNKELNKFV